MARIRSLKPEWVDDQVLHEAGLLARFMSVCLIMLADDYGNGRAHEGQLAGRLFWNEDDGLGKVREGLARLSEAGFVSLYEVRGQRYFHIENWEKHQRVDHPSKPHVPGPEEGEKTGVSASLKKPSRDPRETLGPDQDQDQDQDLDQDQDRQPHARGRTPTREAPPGPGPLGRQASKRPPPDLTSASGRYRDFEERYLAQEGGTGLGEFHPKLAQRIEKTTGHVGAEAWTAELEGWLYMIQLVERPRKPITHFLSHFGQWAVKRQDHETSVAAAARQVAHTESWDPASIFDDGGAT